MMKLTCIKGSALIESAVFSMLFMMFIVFSVSHSVSLFDLSKETRAAGAAAQIIEQILEENLNPDGLDISLIGDILMETNHLSRGEDYAFVVSEFENDEATGYGLVRSFTFGPNTSSASKVILHDSSSPEPGVEVDGYIYPAAITEYFYVVEVFTGKRGRVKSSGGELPFYDFAVFYAEKP